MAGRFTVQEGFENMVQYAMRFEHDFIKIGGRYYRRKNEILSPSETLPKYYHHEIEIDWSIIFCWIQQNAELMRWTLVDESIPLESKKKSFDIFDGCRRTNAIAIGMLKYWPALPELREAMLHDSDWYMRDVCISSLGEMPKHAYQYRKDILLVAQTAKVAWVQEEAVQTLKKLNDKDCALALYELYFETRDRIRNAEYKDMSNNERSQLILLRTIVEALIKLDVELAREVLAVGLIDSNPHIWYNTKSAFELTRERHQLKIMRSNFANPLGFLPQNLSWLYRLRR